MEEVFRAWWCVGAAEQPANLRQQVRGWDGVASFEGGLAASFANFVPVAVWAWFPVELPFVVACMEDGVVELFDAFLEPRAGSGSHDGVEL